jgi:TonB-linked SusC/RagA family outer membrane protein
MKKMLLAFAVMLLMLNPNYLLAQNRTISGKITDENGQPIAYASISIKGSKKGMAANSDGMFSLTNVSSASIILKFSAIGYEDKELSIDAKTNSLDIKLKSGTAISEVVVTAFGVKQQKKALGYAATEINSKQIMESKQPNLVNALQGRVAGVQVNSTGGGPGQGARIVIRGPKSALGSNQPLFVIDGVIVDNSTVIDGGVSLRGMSNRISDVNPDDVESMSILRGGAATALYGFRGSNGVIVITTKTAKAGKVKVSYNTTLGTETVNKFPDVQTTYTQGYNNVYNPSDFFPSFGPSIAIAKTLDPTHPDQLFNHYARAYETGSQFRNTINISGGTDKALISSSLSYFTHKGVLPNTDYKNLSARINASLKLSEKLKINPSINYINSGGLRYNADRFNESLTYWSPRWDVRDYKNPDGTHKTYGNNNPVFGAYYNLFRDNVDRLLSNLAINYSPLSWLDISYRIGYDFTSDNRRATAPAQVPRAGVISFADNVLGFVGEYRVINKVLNSNFLATGRFKLNDKFNLTARVGQDLVDQSYNFQQTEGRELDVPTLLSLNNAKFITQNSRRTQLRTVGIFADATLNYNNYLYLSATGRNDWASSVASGNQSFFYPSISLGYVFSQHVRMPSWIQYGKLRGSYAKIGIAPVTPYLTNTYYNNAFGQPVNNVIGWTRDDVKGASELRPEFTDNREVGLEMQFLKGRIGLDFSYYKINSKDVVNSVLVANTTGFNSFVLNSGEIENKGIELVINGTPIKNKNFTWDISANFTSNRNRVISLAPGLNDIVITSQSGYLSSGATQRWVVGNPVGGLYGIGYQRYYGTEVDDKTTLRRDLPLLIATTGTGAGFPIRDVTNQRLIGNSLPRAIWGINNSFTYKQFNLSFLFDIRSGYQRYNQLANFMSAFGIAKYTEDRNSTRVFDGVVAGGAPNTQTVWLGQQVGPDGRNYGDGFYRLIHRGVTENFIEDAGWVRLRTLTLNYNLPSKLFKKISLIKDASISLTGNNLLLWTKYSGYDPESSSTSADSNGDGFSGFTYPGVRSYFVTLNVNF